MAEKLKVFFIHTMNAGTTWYRIKGYAGVMSEFDDVEVRMNAYDPINLMGAWWEPHLFTPQILNEFMDTFEQWGPDIIVAQKFACKEGIAFIDTCKHYWPILTEIDDDFLNVPNWNPAFAPENQIHYYGAKQIMNSNALICSTPYLKSLMAEWFNDKSYVIPNGIDIKYWDNLPKPSPHNGLYIGWVGAASHQYDLELLIPVIPEVNRLYGDKIYWLFMSGAGIPDEFRKYPNVKVIKEWWAANEYARAVKLKGFDIGLAPLRDHPFNLSKSNLRWLEYSAMNIPTVASNIGHFRETLEDGQTAILCDNTEEWIEGLSCLIDCACVRKEIGENAKEEIKKNWNLDKISREYADILRQEVKAHEKH